MAEYLILIYGDEAAMEAGGQPLYDELMAGHNAFGEKHGPSLRGGNALQPKGTATTIRTEGDRALVTDGPFAETKETLGGYYLVEAKDLHAPHGGVEVRPIRVFG